MTPVAQGDVLRVERGSLLHGLRPGDGLEVLAVDGLGLRVRCRSSFARIERTLSVASLAHLGADEFWASTEHSGTRYRVQLRRVAL